MTVLVPLPGPLDPALVLERLRRWGDDLLDRWDGSRLVRTVTVGERSIAFACSFEGTVDRPVARIQTEVPTPTEVIATAVRAGFLETPPEFADLTRHDPVLAALEARFPGFRPMRDLNLYGALVRAISAQQVNLRWAAETRRRLAETFGDRHQVAGYTVYSLNPARLAGVSVAEVRGLQFTTRKAEYIVGLAQEIAAGRLATEQLAILPDDEVVARLSALRGIGRWTAEWILARLLGRPRVVAGDLGVRKAVGIAYLGTPIASETEVRAATAHWGASSALAQELLLQGLALGCLEPPAPVSEQLSGPSAN